jgi:hypothetical protein
MAHRSTVWLALAAVGLACGGGDGITETDTINGVKYTARTNSLILADGERISIIATLENVSSVNQDREYPATCPVRIRLYRPADGFKMYDETLTTCVSDTVTLSIPVAESRDLQSGLRKVTDVLGDSLPYNTYAVRAVVQTEGPGVLEVVAGPWTPVQPAPARPASKQR